MGSICKACLNKKNIERTIKASSNRVIKYAREIEGLMQDEYVKGADKRRIPAMRSRCLQVLSEIEKYDINNNISEKLEGA